MVFDRTTLVGEVYSHGQDCVFTRVGVSRT